MTPILLCAFTVRVLFESQCKTHSAIRAKAWVADFLYFCIFNDLSNHEETIIHYCHYPCLCLCIPNITKATHIADVPFVVRVDEYTYTVDTNGRLATMVEMYGAPDDNLTANFTFNREER